MFVLRVRIFLLEHIDRMQILVILANSLQSSLSVYTFQCLGEHGHLMDKAETNEISSTPPMQEASEKRTP